MTPEAALIACRSQQGVWVMKRTLLESTRANLPRKEKAEAARLGTQIDIVNGWLRDLRPTRLHYQALADRAEQQGMWAEAVHNVAGPEVLREVYAYMKARKKTAPQQAVTAA
jgi:hypothetical protein